MRRKKLNCINLKKYQWLLLVSVLIFCSRLIGFGEYPGGVHVDEAYAGYEAWTLLNYGMDSWGYNYPVYLTVWGSGMSVLNSLLMIPFIKLWGLNEVTIRLPQVIIAIISIYTFYFFVRKIQGVAIAKKAIFLIAICPWHIMMSRWGLDCNLASGFIVIAGFFFVLGIEKNKYFIISAIFWGLSLYCYAAIWIFVPVVLVLWGGYCFRSKKVNLNKYVVCSMLIVFVFAIPLLMFLAVNFKLINEIRTPWISIPQLVIFRADELSFDYLFDHIKQFLKLFIKQNDGNISNAIPLFGMYYLLSLPFIVLGFVTFLKNLFLNFKNKEFCYEYFIVAWIMTASLCGIIQGVNVYQINYIHFPVIILWAVGVNEFFRKFGKNIKISTIGIYACSFLIFICYYFSDFQEQISRQQLEGSREAIEKAMILYEKEEYEAICITEELRHSRILFYTQYPLAEYLENVIWQNYPDKFLRTKSFGPFVWGIETLNDECVYIVEESELSPFLEEGWIIEKYGYMRLVYRP